MNNYKKYGGDMFGTFKKIHLLGLPILVVVFLVFNFHSKEQSFTADQHKHLYHQLDKPNNIESVKINNFESFQKPLTNNKKRASKNEIVEAVKSNIVEFSKLLEPDYSKSTKEKNYANIGPLIYSELEKFGNDFNLKSLPKITVSNTGKITSIFPQIKSDAFISDDAEVKNMFIKDMINDYPKLFGATETSNTIIDKTVCNPKTCSITVKKEYEGIQSWDQSLVFTTSNSILISVQGDFSPPSIDLNHYEKLNEKQIKHVVAKYFSVDTSDLKIRSEIGLGLGSTHSHDYIGYKLNVGVVGKGPYEVKINSRSKEVVEVIPLRMNFFTDSSGLDLDDTEIEFKSYFSNDIFYLIDDRFPEGSLTYVQDANNLDYQDPNINIAYSPLSNSGWNKTAVTAIKNTQLMMDFFSDSYNYDALGGDSRNLNIVVNATLDGAVNNAYWISDQKTIAFGKGDGFSTKNFASALDVHAHELTHGVISSTSNLLYVYQSGALNESFADFFGTQVDDSNWTVGEDLYFDGSAMRSLANPNLYGQPGHMSEYLYLPLSTDNGGVHYNSGIPNRALYLMAEGLSNEGLGVSIGREKAGIIAWTTMIGLSNRASFDDAANLMIALAEAFFGVDSQEAISTNLAWGLVGLPANSTSISESVVNSHNTSTHNSLLYLNPIFSPELVPPVLNSYDLYAQIFPNNNPSFSAQNNFGPLNQQPASSARPVTVNLDGGGFITFYRGIDGFIYGYESETGYETKLDFGFTINDISVSVEGNLIALVADEAPVIFVFNTDSQELKHYDVSGPDFSESGRTSSNVEYIDTIRFDPTSRKIIFDYLTCPYSDDVCLGEDLGGFWSIGILDLNSNDFFYPFPFQNENANIGYPTFSNLSEQYIAFDLIYPDEQDVTKFSSQIVIYDLYEDEIRSVVGFPDTSDIQSGQYGLASFVADDTGIVFSSRSNSNQSYMYHASIFDYALNSLQAPFSLINPYFGYFPYSTPLVALDRKPALTLEAVAVNFGDIINDELVSESFCVSNDDLFPINLDNVNSENDSFTWNGSGREILSGQNLCADLNLNANNISHGFFETTISLVHDGANSPSPINITANILSATDYDNDGYENSVDDFPNNPNEWLDTDSDGTGNNTDIDDDGDGVLDEADAFPLDASDWNDFDQDGIGDNADNDDDNDGVEDSLDLFPLDRMEWTDFDLDGIGDNSDNDDDNDGVDDFVDAFPFDGSKWTADVPDDSNSDNLSWDFDGNGTADALTDGLMMLRFAFGLTGVNVTNGAIADNSDMSSEEVLSNLNNAKDSLLTDIDGNGVVDALTDGLMLLRALFGLSGDNVITGAIGNEATRISATDVATYISDHMPN
jgi:Zn-dependent metalloprotease